MFSVMFSTILEEADEETASRMVPVILERVGLLYPVQDYRKEIHEYDILSSTQSRETCQISINVCI